MISGDKRIQPYSLMERPTTYAMMLTGSSIEVSGVQWKNAHCLRMEDFTLRNKIE